MMDERIYDAKIDELAKKFDDLQRVVNEIRQEQKSVSVSLIETKEKTMILSQRQGELTIPKLEKIEKCLYGNGVAGLMQEHIKCQDKLNLITAISSKVSGIIITLITSIFSFAMGYAVVYFKVEHLWRLIVK